MGMPLPVKACKQGPLEVMLNWPLSVSRSPSSNWQELLEAELTLEETQKAEEVRLAAEESEFRRKQDLQRQQDEERKRLEQLAREQEEADRLLAEAQKNLQKEHQKLYEQESQITLDCIPEEASYVAFKDVGNTLESVVDFHSTNGSLLEDILPDENIRLILEENELQIFVYCSGSRDNKRQRDAYSTTMMLIVVIAVFLSVESPLMVITALHTISSR